MNDEQRAALVDELARAVATVRNARPYDIETDEEREFIRYQAETHFMPIIDHLFDDRAEQKLDEDTVKRLVALVANGSDNPYAVMSARAKVKEVLARAMPKPELGEQIERAAKAMYTWLATEADDAIANHFPRSFAYTWDGLNKQYPSDGETWRNVARAALQAAARAMPEPDTIEATVTGVQRGGPRR